MYPTVEATTWFRQRNLGAGPMPTSSYEFSQEVEIYLLVTLAHRPVDLPVEVKAYLAVRYFGHCTEVSEPH